MLRVVTTRPVEKEIQDAVNQIPEIKVGGVFGVSTDEETTFACVVGEDVTTDELLRLRQGCKELLVRIDKELENRRVHPDEEALMDILRRLIRG